MSDNKINYKNVMEFKDIPDGAHFRELRNDPRTFIKIKLSYASGLPYTVCLIPDDMKDKTETMPRWTKGFNCLDYRGHFGKCPDWVKFEVTDKTI